MWEWGRRGGDSWRGAGGARDAGVAGVAGTRLACCVTSHNGYRSTGLRRDYNSCMNALRQVFLDTASWPAAGPQRQDSGSAPGRQMLEMLKVGVGASGPLMQGLHFQYNK